MSITSSVFEEKRKMKQLITATKVVHVFRTAMTAQSLKSWFQNSIKSTC